MTPTATRHSGFRPLLPQRSLTPLHDADEYPIIESSTPLKRTRIAAPRSRSGCSTCRARRVKCDETLPSCARCARAKLRCDGYPSARAKAGRTSVTLPVIAPKPITPLEAVARLPRAVADHPPIQGQDVAYFDYFRHQVVRELASGYYTQLWSVVISESIHDDYIRDSALAIGALALGITSSIEDQYATASTGRPSPLAPWPPELPANRHHRAALLYHLRAVSRFRSFITTGTAALEPRKGIIMTLMLSVYEMLQGHLSASDDILSCGMAVFRYSITLFLGTQTPGSGMEEIEHVLPRLVIMGLFTHRYNSAWKYIHHLKAEPEFEFPSTGIDATSKVFALWGRFFTLATTCLGQATHDGTWTVFETGARQANFLRGLREWKPILEHYLTLSAPDSSDRRAFCLILLHWDVIWVSMNSSLDPTGLAFDAFTAQFRGLLRRCMEYIQMELRFNAPRLMTLGEGVLMPLLCIVKCCRDHDLRMTAAAIAYGIPWRESTWDARVVLLGNLKAVSMEEEGRDSEGFVPPYARWHWRGGDLCAGTDKMLSKYVRHQPDENGNAFTKTLTVDLNQWPDICTTVGCLADHLRTFQNGEF